MVQLNDYDVLYWHYEYDLVAKHLLPLLQTWGMTFRGIRMLDVGCGDGGGVCAMYDVGMHCKGFDIEPRRVSVANQLRESRSFEMVHGDVYADPPPFGGEQFDFVVLHDVFEHLDRKAEMLKRLEAYLAPSGKLMITFPPYYSAFGAHQQLLNSPVKRLPFFHLIPFAISHVLPRLQNESPDFVAEIQKLARNKMGMGRFEELVEASALSIDQRECYVISPNHIRFGLQPLGAGPLGSIPLVRELVTSGVVYLLSSRSR